MIRTTAFTAALTLLVAGPTSVASQSAAPLAAGPLVTKVLDARMTPGLKVRTTLTRTMAGSNAKQVRQLLLLGRRDRTGSMASYQQLWPVEAAPRALVIRTNATHQVSGFSYESGRSTPLTAEAISNRFFDSDLLIEDLVEGFWHWGSPRVVGEEWIGENRCTIVEFHPGPGVRTSYSWVKAWVAPEMAVPLRVEYAGRDGQLIKRLGMYRMLKVGSRWLPGILTVEPAGGASRTVLEGTATDQEPRLTAADFTIEALKRAIRPLK